MSRLTSTTSSKQYRAMAGFTIIELMIATMVFSVVLILMTAGLIDIGRTYYKGVSDAQTQSAASGLANSFGQDVQFSGGAVLARSGTYSMWCVGSRRYTYAPGLEQGASGSPQNVLVADTATGSCSGSTPIPDLTKPLNDPQYSDAQSLLGTKMRVAKFAVTPGANNTYAIDVRVVYGDDDLLCSPSVAGDCSSTAMSTHLNNTDLACKNFRAGTQFCAASEINTTVVKRVN